MFHMEIRGALPKNNRVRKMRRLHPELDNEISATDAVTTALARYKSIRFHVSGFGEPRWRVDVWTDLCIVVEQIPQIVYWLRGRTKTEMSLDFYEQGVERSIKIHKRGSRVVLEGVPFAGRPWTPSIPLEVMPKAAFERMLLDLLLRFADLGDSLYPGIWNEPVIQDWTRLIHETRAARAGAVDATLG
jgi:hypothetical protein